MNVFANGYVTPSVCDVLLNSPIALKLDFTSSSIAIKNMQVSLVYAEIA